jgi:uncharacterized protein (TIGR02300 family)
MNQDKWGVKRVCLSCAARFYDFNKSPILCPACNAVFDPEYLSKRKSRIVQEKSTDTDEADIEVVDTNLIDEANEDINVLDEADGDIPIDDEKN